MPGVATSPATEAVLTTAPRLLAQHHRQHMAQAQEHAFDIDADDGVEHRLVVIDDRRHLAFDAGIVEEAVDPAISLERCCT